MRGRKPKPSAVKKLRGNPGKRKLPKAEPTPAARSGPRPPDHLSDDAHDEWRRVVAELEPLGIITALDLGLLAAWCTAWGDYVEAERRIAEQGAVIEDKDGKYRRNPWCMLKSKAIEQMTRLGSEFGFSPASRPRVGAPAARGLNGKQPNGSTGRPGAPQSLGDYLAGNPARSAVH